VAQLTPGAEVSASTAGVCGTRSREPLVRWSASPLVRKSAGPLVRSPLVRKSAGPDLHVAPGSSDPGGQRRVIAELRAFVARFLAAPAFVLVTPAFAVFFAA
jgi:hypothetical protein